MQEAQERTKHVNLERLRTLFGGEPYVPDFLTPPPEAPFPEFEEELERIVKTGHDQVREDIAHWRRFSPDSAATVADASSRIPIRRCATSPTTCARTGTPRSPGTGRGSARSRGQRALPRAPPCPRGRRSRGGIDELIGDTRAEILRTLEIPMTTSELATKLGVTSAAVSQQLAVLRRAGVVDADRVGRSVYSRRTGLGESLLGLLT